ncbi:AMMECR1 domain-containing protein [candidate division TA06 bacterium]|uniref:AMMECR1 domain-containing protein n=1 Tax=candidate division TA06 bacterium TaxID=2250710 RepID=A0A660SNJ7_UNCT6|nr:MAG: AMMECR1 domain-containing protein [candidate division TA06 bacterium]
MTMFTREEKIELIGLARQSIESTLLNKNESPETKCENLKKKGAAFTTLMIDNILRGCIGYIQAVKPLYITVWETAQSAAFGDPRFPSLTIDEFPKIKIELSVMTPLQKIDDYYDFEIGKHGLYIKHGFYSGLLLPQVALKYKWDKEKFLREVCYKAGLPADTYKQGADIFKFAAEIFSED